MRPVPDLADVLFQEGSRQRGLSDVGMRDKTQVDREVFATHGDLHLFAPMPIRGFGVAHRHRRRLDHR